MKNSAIGVCPEYLHAENTASNMPANAASGLNLQIRKLGDSRTNLVRSGVSLSAHFLVLSACLCRFCNNQQRTRAPPAGIRETCSTAGARRFNFPGMNEIVQPMLPWRAVEVTCQCLARCVRDGVF
jgi:hypothetical protein